MKNSMRFDPRFSTSRTAEPLEQTHSKCVFWGTILSQLIIQRQWKRSTFRLWRKIQTSVLIKQRRSHRWASPHFSLSCLGGVLSHLIIQTNKYKLNIFHHISEIQTRILHLKELILKPLNQWSFCSSKFLFVCHFNLNHS